MSAKQAVKVGIRVRPLNSREKQMNSQVIISSQQNKLTIRNMQSSKQFIFDYVFDMDSRQQTIYQHGVYSLVENALQGYNGTIFAYGQTGAGKTFTMMGQYTDPEIKGIIPRTFDHLIVAIQTSPKRKFVLRTSFIEIYNEEVIDLLEENKSKSKKSVKENPQSGVYVQDMKMIPVKSINQMFTVLDIGNKCRTVGSTLMNATSSRSHALFIVHIESLQGQDKVRSSKINLVDLAGSQRQSKTQATGQRLKEGAKINLSLSALGNVINALVQGKKGGHIPYRDSKLTRLLQTSLGGNTKTLMIASISPAFFNYDESLSTLRYAARARNIKNTPKINQDPKDSLIRQYYQQIQRLKKQLQNTGGSVNEKEIQQIVSEKQKKLNEKQQQLLDMTNRLKEMQQLMLRKSDVSEEVIKNRKMKKKKIMKMQEIANKKLKQLEQQDEGLTREESQTKVQNMSQQEKTKHYKKQVNLLKKKLKTVIEDKNDRERQFEDEREDLNRTVRSLEQDLSFYRQIAQKFLSTADISHLQANSTLDVQKRQYNIVSFLLHNEKLTLPKALKQHEADDLWKERRKDYKMEIVKSKKQEESNTQQPLKTASQFLSNRKIIEDNFDSPIYKQKKYTTQDADRVIFRRTDFNFRIASRSRSRSTSKSSNTQQ